MAKVVKAPKVPQPEVMSLQRQLVSDLRAAFVEKSEEAAKLTRQAAREGWSIEHLQQEFEKL